MDVSTDDLSAFLNRAWQHAAEGANTLPAQLVIEQQSALDLLADGSVASVGKNSTSQSYGFYGPGNLTHRQIVNVFTTLIRYYDSARQQIVAAALESDTDLTDFDFDPSVYALITKYLQVSQDAVTLPDITRLRLPACGLIPAGVTW